MKLLLSFAMLFLGLSTTASADGEIWFLIDASGSMGGKETLVVNGINSMLQQLEQQPGSNGVSVKMFLFNQERSLLMDTTPLLSSPRILASQYQPDGMTALFQSLAVTLGEIPSNSTLVIATDGEDTVGGRTVEETAALIRDARARGVEFRYICEGEESFNAGISLGLTGDPAQVTQTPVGTLGSAFSSQTVISGILSSSAFSQSLAPSTQDPASTSSTGQDSSPSGSDPAISRKRKHRN